MTRFVTKGNRVYYDYYKKELSKGTIYLQNIILFALEARKRHTTLTYQPGECVGVQTAQNIGESFTQGVLNSFHKTGNSDALVKVTRIGELLNVSKKPKSGPNVWELYSRLGIEAVRSFLLQEFKEVLEDAPKAFLSLLVDKMCYEGYPTPINRHGQKEACTNSRASFEESLKVLLGACMEKKVDDMSGVSANVLFGQEPHMGANFTEVVLGKSF